MFPDEPKNPAKLHHLSNYLLRNAEDYLAWEEWVEDDSDRLFYLLKACRKRGLSTHFKEVAARLHRQRTAQPLRHPAHYRFNYLLAYEEYQQSMSSGRSNAEPLQPLSEWHDMAFVAEKLKNACILASRQRINTSTDLDSGLLPAVLEFVRERPQLLDIPAIGVYYHGYMALCEPEEETHFFNLKKCLPDADRQFPVSELRDIYLLAVNFCIHRINLRQEKYLREVFDLYQSGLNSGVFWENRHISRFTYTNIAMTGLRLKEFNWTYRFLQEYKPMLPEAHQQGAFSFNLARYFCEKGDYDRAMQLLQEMDFDDVLHNLAAKAMLLRIYFETGANNALDSLLASLSTYLRRKRQVSEQQRQAYQHLISFTKRLLSMPQRAKTQRRQLGIEIQNTVPVAEKDWLLQITMND